jgi:hypothetical protein
MEITAEATKHLVELRKRRGFGIGEGVRIMRDSGRLGLSFAARPERGDAVIETPEIEIYLAPDVSEQMTGSVMDTREVDGRVSLVARPRAGRGGGPTS